VTALTGISFWTLEDGLERKIGQLWFDRCDAIC
jgi:hypothetical protein